MNAEIERAHKRGEHPSYNFACDACKRRIERESRKFERRFQHQVREDMRIHIPALIHQAAITRTVTA